MQEDSSRDSATGKNAPLFVMGGFNEYLSDIIPGTANFFENEGEVPERG